MTLTGGTEESEVISLFFYIKVIVIWVMKPCSLVVTYIAGMCCLFKVQATLKMKAAHPSKTLVRIYHYSVHIPQGITLIFTAVRCSKSLIICAYNSSQLFLACCVAFQTEYPHTHADTVYKLDVTAEISITFNQ